MKKFLHYILLILILCSCKKAVVNDKTPSPNTDTLYAQLQSVPVTKTNKTQILMHYQPWFETKASNNGQWGIHWTMSYKNPDLILDSTTMRRQIASHYYPLIGTYHSGDSALIEYHLLLMKYAGIDAVVIDWYGTHDVYDYKTNFDNTDRLVKRTKEVGLDFGVVYEPTTTQNVQNISGMDKSTAAALDMSFLKTNYFNQTNFLNINSEKVFFSFGNNFTGPEWNYIFQSAGTFPAMFLLQYSSSSVNSILQTSGEFYWVYADDSTGQINWNKNYSGPKLAGAYPGFKDYYLEGGWTTSHINWTIDVSANTLRDRLNLTKKINSNVVQIQTFNDFGEGTMIEPTVEFGYSFLNEIQKFTGVNYSTPELELIYKYYRLRTGYNKNIPISDLRMIFSYLVALRVSEAQNLINKYY